MQDEFRKRVYSLGEFFPDLVSLGRNSFNLVRAMNSRRIGREFHAKLNMAVIGVLGCRYCSWLHSGLALNSGVQDGELRQLLSQELGDFPEEESVALAFAQHYSETGGRPDKAATERLYEYYGAETSEDIELYLQMIYFGNLAGNTIDAFLHRLRGRPTQGSSITSELVIFLMLGPYYLVILPLIATILHRKKRLSNR